MGQSTPTDKKYFTVTQANAMLPLVQRIIADITSLAADIRDRHERLSRIASGSTTDMAHEEELREAGKELEQDVEQVKEYQEELTKLGVLLKDYFTGLVDFPCWVEGREVYLCWKQGETSVEWWHEIEAGFAGRQPISGDPALAEVL